jgi:phosphatidylglycerophosphate synthase
VTATEAPIEALTPPRRRGLWGPADLVTALRLPLAIAFLAIDHVGVRLAVIVVAAGSDFVDGWVARRWGSSRAGPVLDPIFDKGFTVAVVLALVPTRTGSSLGAWEITALLMRDLAVLGGFLTTLALRRPVTIPARFSGKLVTALQFTTLGALLLEWSLVRPLVWTTAAASLWAIAEYTRDALQQIRAARRAAGR